MSLTRPMNINRNPLVFTVFEQKDDSTSAVPTTTKFIITESGLRITAENGNSLTTEN